VSGKSCKVIREEVLLTKYYLERNFGLGTAKLILGYVVEIIRKQFM
jgi:hypothetical protein